MFCAHFISGSSDFTPFFTSGTLHARRLLEISIHTADACILAMSCSGHARARGEKPFRASLKKSEHGFTKQVIFRLHWNKMN